MAVSCDNCGGIVRRDSEKIMLTHDDWYAHRFGICPVCESKVQWHRAIAGRLGSGYLFTYSRPPQRCTPECPNYDPGAGLAAQV